MIFSNLSSPELNWESDVTGAPIKIFTDLTTKRLYKPTIFCFIFTFLVNHIHVCYFMSFRYVFYNVFIFIVTTTTQGLCVLLGDLFYGRYFLFLVFQLLRFICLYIYLCVLNLCFI